MPAIHLLSLPYKIHMNNIRGITFHQNQSCYMPCYSHYYLQESVSLMKLFSNRPGYCPEVLSHKQLQEFRSGMDLHHNRSEEHTSELQSRQYLVCRLLLDKK